MDPSSARMDGFPSSNSSNQYQNLFMKAVQSGGLFVGIFREEPVQSFMECMEYAAVTCISSLRDYILKKNYRVEELPYIMPSALDSIEKWEDDDQEDESKRIIKVKPHVLNLFELSSMIYVREIYRHIKPGDKIDLCIPEFTDYLFCFMKFIAKDSFVRAGGLLDGTKLVERKMIIMCAMRAAFDECIRKNVAIKYQGLINTPDAMTITSTPTPSGTPAQRKIVKEDYDDDVNAENVATPLVSLTPRKVTAVAEPKTDFKSDPNYRSPFGATQATPKRSQPPPSTSTPSRSKTPEPVRPTITPFQSPLPSLTPLLTPPKEKAPSLANITPLMAPPTPKVEPLNLPSIVSKEPNLPSAIPPSPSALPPLPSPIKERQPQTEAPNVAPLIDFQTTLPPLTSPPAPSTSSVPNDPFDFLYESPKQDVRTRPTTDIPPPFPTSNSANRWGLSPKQDIPILPDLPNLEWNNLGNSTPKLDAPAVKMIRIPTKGSTVSKSIRSFSDINGGAGAGAGPVVRESPSFSSNKRIPYDRYPPQPNRHAPTWYENEIEEDDDNYDEVAERYR